MIGCLSFNSLGGQSDISIHASAKEATSTCCRLASYSKISIHASAKEATYKTFCSYRLEKISIHASAKEATDSTIVREGFAKFQSTPPRRRRPYLAPNCCVHCIKSFQSTPPRRRRLIKTV